MYDEKKDIVYYFFYFRPRVEKEETAIFYFINRKQNVYFPKKLLIK